MFAPRDRAAFEEARRLRSEQGLALKRIAAQVGVSVSTVHAWTRDISLTAEQRRRNLRGPGGPHDPARVAARAEAWARTCREQRLAHQLEGRERARQQDPLHQAGCMLYWAEGTKKRNSVRLSNSDVHLMRLFVLFLRRNFAITNEDCAIRLHVYLNNGRPLRQIEGHWLDALQLPRSSLRKHSVDPLPTSSSGAAKNKLPFGVCTLQVRASTRIVQHIYGAIQEYAGFEEPRWLDGPPRKPPGN